MKLTWNLSYLHETSKHVQEADVKVRVKGKDFILDVLKDCWSRFETIFSVLNIQDLEDSVKKRIEHYEDYQEHYVLTRKDGEALQEEVFEWYNRILDQYPKGQPS